MYICVCVDFGRLLQNFLQEFSHISSLVFEMFLQRAPHRVPFIRMKAFAKYKLEGKETTTHREEGGEDGE